MYAVLQQDIGQFFEVATHKSKCVQGPIFVYRIWDLIQYITYLVSNNSEHRKMRAKQQHVCKEMNQYMINTNRKWILSFGIEWTIRVKYRK